jgi:hedgehog protein
MIYREHQPNADETAEAASGPPQGAIERGSKRYKNLFANYNEDIVFKNEEGTWDDRLMTRRCLEKLDTLSVLVMNRWPGVKLRVIEAWDDTPFHGYNSLHYEGRAVDLTTSDKDRSKYGMLARLAVLAGFDYVHYESRFHVHASVRIDGAHADRLRGCFHPDSTVQLQTGTSVPIHSLRVGDRVLTLSSSTGQQIYTPVILFLERDQSRRVQFLQITTASKTNSDTLIITPNHLIQVWRCVRNSPGSSNVTTCGPPQDANNTFDILSQLTVIPALLLKPKLDFLVTFKSGSKPKLAQILAIKPLWRAGAIAPLTLEGTMVTNQMLTSCYASVASESLAHWSFLPARVLYRVFPSWFEDSQQSLSSVGSTEHNNPEGIHWYARFLIWLSDCFLFVDLF